MLHLLGIVAPDARLPEIGSVRLIDCDDAAMVVQEIPPDFGSEATRALTEALMTEGWGAMCRLAETSTVVALRFGQIVENEDAARGICAKLTEEGVFDRKQGFEEWTVTFFPKQNSEVRGRGYLAARSNERRRQADLTETVRRLATKIDSLEAMSAPVASEQGVSVQLLVTSESRSGTLEGIESMAEEEGLDARAVGPQPILHFTDGGA